MPANIEMPARGMMWGSPAIPVQIEIDKEKADDLAEIPSCSDQRRILGTLVDRDLRILRRTVEQVLPGQAAQPRSRRRPRRPMGPSRCCAFGTTDKPVAIILSPSSL